MSDANISPQSWDTVEHLHVSFYHQDVIYRLQSLKMRHCDHCGVVPDLAVFPPSGCFCIFYGEKIEREDVKLNAQNESGVFLAFGHLENTFGVVILIK
jgi:hypothetical protein